MEGLLIEEGAMNNLRRSSYINNSGNMYGYYNNINNYSAVHAFASVSSIDQILLNANGGNGFVGGSLHRPPPLYSSLPHPVQIQHRPPLLPLPIKSVTLPSTTKKIGGSPPGTSIVRSSSSSMMSRHGDQKRRKKKITRASVGPKMKEPETRKVGALRPAMEEEDTEEEFLIGMPAPAPAASSVYSVSSPPPSSLPLPRLLLMRARSARAAAGSCVAEAMVDSGAAAADDLRKFLRL